MNEIRFARRILSQNNQYLAPCRLAIQQNISFFIPEITSPWLLPKCFCVSYYFNCACWLRP
ncbi:unnamed protein product [Amoebophrya sp. A25]|nr:unnamed protein product [Amoebophrya sp. A25]|eukprot:GSA25T00009924001.1